MKELFEEYFSIIDDQKKLEEKRKKLKEKIMEECEYEDYWEDGYQIVLEDWFGGYDFAAMSPEQKEIFKNFRKYKKTFYIRRNSGYGNQEF